jgi:caffeoyl-CoA O-methyltransferase
MKNYSQTSSEIESYVERVFHPKDPVLNEIRERASLAGLPDIHVGDMDGLHLEVLARAIGAKKIVEIGTLAGFSGVCLARALPPGGKLYTFEFKQEHADVALESFRKAGLADRVEIFVGPAVEKLKEIEKDGPFDIVFIDADKPSYPAYFEWAVSHLRKGGAILADNTFAMGEIASDKPNSARVEALRRFNAMCASDPRLRATILPTSDGLTFAVRI